MKYLLFLTTFLFNSFAFSQPCPDDITDNNQNGDTIIVYVYNSSFEIIDTIGCKKAGNSNNINCTLNGGSYYVIPGSGCVYNSIGVLVGSLPIELLSFSITNQGIENILVWETASENNNDYFTIERSEDGISWKIINNIEGAVNSTENIRYEYIDTEYNNIINYYRLSQTDFDGKSETFDIVYVDNRMSEYGNKPKGKVVKIINLMGQEVDEHYGGYVFYIFSNNNVVKYYQY